MIGTEATAATAVAAVSDVDERPLALMTDDTVREHVVRLAAAVGCELHHVTDSAAARPRWSDAPLVLIDHVPDVIDVPRRSGVLLVRTDTPTPEQWKAAVALGVDGVAVLPADEDVVVTALADVAEKPSDREGRVLAVIGGRGGAGASVLAASVGLAAARSGGAALLVDCDPLGGGLDLVLGAEADEGLRWSDVRVSSGRVSMAELDAVLPFRRRGRGRMSILSCDRTGPGPTEAALAAVADAGRRAGRTVVCDVPRHPSPAADEVLRRADLAVLVVPADVRGCVSAARVRHRLSERIARIAVVVRASAATSLSEADVVEAVGAPVLGWLRDERSMVRAMDRGRFDPGRRIGKVSGTVLSVLAES